MKGELFYTVTFEGNQKLVVNRVAVYLGNIYLFNQIFVLELNLFAMLCIPQTSIINIYKLSSLKIITFSRLKIRRKT